MKTQKWKYTALAAILLHSIIFGSELYLMLRQKSIPFYLRYFTNLSNLLAGAASLIMIITLAAALIHDRCKLLRWAVLLQLVAACSVGLTFLVVLTFLSPNHVREGGSYWDFFSGETFHTHFFNCLLSGICAALLHPDVRIRKKESWLGILPTLVYGAVYAVCVFNGTWPDFYNFTSGMQLGIGLIALLIMSVVSLLLSFGYSSLHNHQLQQE